MISKRGNIDVKFVESNANANTYDERLDYMLQFVINNPSSLIIASEVYLSGFDYDNMEQASHFSEFAIEKLLETTKDQIVVFSAIRKIDNDFVNQAIVINQHKICHIQEKAKLFKLGNEDKYFKAGKTDCIVPFEINGLKIGILICFELRFKELWKQLEGCDIVVVPAKWGKPRELHFKVLSNALAIMNQCFVAAHSSGDETMTNMSSIYSPNGEKVDNIDLREITKIRRYIVME
jgi:predicted amidohydrolase